ncbi:MAG: hypothetical protein JWO55_604 [Candidatus Saccharibacteria bacterium]|jgi:hypothetical protein|nr:hypothetical protein [Candidatus Saccharibacteria bacterium]
MKMQKKLGAAVLSLGLVVGLSGFAGAATGTIDDTGPRSDNTIHSETSQRVDVENDNNVDVENNNDQSAETGEAEVRGNTEGGDAKTGSALNENRLDAAVSVDNSASTGVLANWGGNGSSNHEATIENTGPRSDNHVTSESRSTVGIDNDNDLSIVNNNTQTATSGDAEVRNNREGGSATTGDATNTNSTTIRFDVTN